MALDPESQKLLDLMAEANRPAWITLTPAAAREQYLSTRAGAQGPRPDGVTVVDRVDEPYPPSAGMDHSVALALEYQGQESWLLLTWAQDRDGGQSASGAGMSEVPADGSFRAWVDEQVRLAVTPKPEDDSAGYLDFADDGSLVASHGVEILEQAHPIRLKDFTLGDEPTGAALLQGPDGKKWYVVVRDVDGVEVIAVPFKTGGPNLAEREGCEPPRDQGSRLVGLNHGRGHPLNDLPMVS